MLGKRELNILAERNIPAIHIPDFIPPVSFTMVFLRFVAAWNKLRIFSLETFGRIVFLDADILVVKNMDELMDIPVPDDTIAACHACVCNPRNISHFPPSWYVLFYIYITQTDQT